MLVAGGDPLVSAAQLHPVSVRIILAFPVDARTVAPPDGGVPRFPGDAQNHRLAALGVLVVDECMPVVWALSPGVSQGYLRLRATSLAARFSWRRTISF